MIISGMLTADTVEGGAAILLAADGSRYELLPPPGWQLDGRARLRDPDGAVVARAGDRITIRGEVDSAMRSIHQVGPIFRISEVVAVKR